MPRIFMKYNSFLLFLLVSISFNALSQKVEKPIVKEHFIHAYSYFQAEQYEEAYKAFDKFLISYPDSSFADEALFLQGECLFIQNKLNNAIGKYETLIQKYSDERLRDEAYYRMGEAYFRLGNYEKAKTAFENLISKFSSQFLFSDENKQTYHNTRLLVDGYYWLAESLYALKDYNSAIGVYQKVAKIDPEYQYADYVQYSLGCGYCEIGKYALAVLPLERVIKDYPNSALIGVAHNKLGETQYQLGKYSEALKHFNYVKTNYKEGDVSAEVQYWLGESLFNLKKFAESVETLNEFVKTHPESPHLSSAYAKLAGAHLQLKDYKAATQAYKQALELDAKNAKDSFHFILAQGLDETGKTQEAIAEYETLITKFPQSEFRHDALYRLGIWQYNQRKFEPMRTHLQEVAETSTNKQLVALSLLALGNSDYVAQKYDDAIEQYQLLVTKYPDEEGVAEAYFEMGLALFEKRDFNGALDALSKSLSKGELSDAQKSRAHYRMGECLYQAGNYRQALQHFKQVVENPFEGQGVAEVPDFGAMAYFWLGESLYNQRKYAEAIKAFNATIDKEPPKQIVSNAYYRIGCAYSDIGKGAEADEAFQKAVGANPETEDAAKALFWFGQALQRQERYAEAIEQYKSLLTKFPNHELRDEANYQIALSHYQNEEIDEAIGAFEKVMDATKESRLIELAHLGLGNAYYNKNLYPKAIEQYQRIPKDFPNSQYVAEAHFWTGLTSLQQGQLDDAYNAYGQTLSAKGGAPFKPQAQWQMAEIRYAQKKYLQAIEDYRKITVSFADSEFAQSAQYHIGDCYFNLEYFENAKEAYQIGLQKYPASPGALRAIYQLGVSNQQLGNYKEAAAFFAEVIQKGEEGDEFTEEAHFHLGYVYYVMEEYRNAATELEKAVQEYPQNPSAPKAQYTIGTAYYELGDYDKAITAFQKTVSDYPQDKFAREAKYTTGLAYHEKGDVTNAINTCEDFLNVYPNDRRAPETQRRIAAYYSSQEKFDEAIEAYRRLIKNYQKSDLVDDSRRDIGVTLMKAKRFDEAIKEFDRLMAEHPESQLVAEIFIEKGIAYYSMQKYDSAIRIFEEFKEQFKHHPLRGKALYYVALTQEGKGDTSIALRTLQKLIDTLPPNEYTIPAHFRKGEILYGDGKYGEAAVAYSKVLNLDKKDKHEDRKLIANAQYKLADSYFKADDYQNAEPAYYRIIQTNSDPKRVAEAKGRLKWIREHPGR